MIKQETNCTGPRVIYNSESIVAIVKIGQSYMTPGSNEIYEGNLEEFLTDYPEYEYNTEEE